MPVPGETSGVPQPHVPRTRVAPVLDAEHDVLRQRTNAVGIRGLPDQAKNA